MCGERAHLHFAALSNVGDEQGHSIGHVVQAITEHGERRELQRDAKLKLRENRGGVDRRRKKKRKIEMSQR